MIDQSIDQTMMVSSTMSWMVMAMIMAMLMATVVVAHNEPNRMDAIHVGNIRIVMDPTIVISVDTSVVQRSGDWVTLSFSGVSNPKKDDWVALYNPSTVDVTRHVPVKYQFCAASATYMATGRGSLKFRILNARDDLIFAMYRNGTTAGVLVAKSNAFTFAHRNEPTQGHLALTSSYDEMRITWTTYNSASPVARWGLVAGEYSYEAAAVTTTYTQQQMCGAPANTTGWHNPGGLHASIMTHLKPNTRYYYIYGDKNENLWSSESSFVTPPLPAADASLDFFIFGDLGQVDIDGAQEKQEVMPASLNTTTSLAADIVNQRVVFHIGDISYARGYMTQWENFFDQIGPVASRMPWMACPGNHERDWDKSGSLFTGIDSGGECGVAYSSRLQMPRPNFDDTWWSRSIGPIHYLSISTEHSWAPGSAQYSYIEKDLASVNRQVTPWLFVGGHRPMYIDSTNNAPVDGDQTVAKLLRQHLEPLFAKYQVDVAFFGHHHSYQRTCAVYNSVCVNASGVDAPSPIMDDATRASLGDDAQWGTVYVVTGAAGAGNSGNIEHPQPKHFVYVDCTTHGYTRAAVTPTSVRLQYVSGHDRRVLDDFTMALPRHRRQQPEQPTFATS